MPNSWVTARPEKFKEQHASSCEQPWFDLAALRALNRRNCPFACDLLGVFRDEESTYVVTSLATEGDLFAYCECLPRPGPARERALQPIVAQLFAAVRWLHQRGLAHGDLSLENIVLTREGQGGNGEGLAVKLIDFGMATLSQTRGGKLRGKQVYLAPEVYRQLVYNTRGADAYALGVVLFAAAAEDYPWASTKPGVCQSFQYCKTYGFTKFLEKRKTPKGGGRLREVFSRPLAELLSGLLRTQPQERLTLCGCHNVGDATKGMESEMVHAKEGQLQSVWESQWLA